METLSFRRSRRSFIWNYILGIGLLLFLFFSGALTSFPPLWSLFFIVLIMIFFLEPEGIIFYRIYRIRKENISEIKGILAKEEASIPYGSISKTILKKGVIGRLLNFGDVLIMSFAGDLNLKGIKHPEKIFNIIEKEVKKRK